jgi:hypothetical protein
VPALIHRGVERWATRQGGQAGVVIFTILNSDAFRHRHTGCGDYGLGPPLNGGSTILAYARDI